MGIFINLYASYKKKFEGQDKLIGSQFQATSLEQVRVPLKLFLGMLLGSFVIFMYEIKCMLKILVLFLMNFV